MIFCLISTKIVLLGISNIIKDSQDIFTMKCLNKKIYIIALLFVLILPFASFADGWIDDGRGNWLYEENGELLKATWKNIDGVNYYFDTQGYWLPTEPLKEIKLVGSERVTFYMEGKDEKNRKYKTKVSVPRPIKVPTARAMRLWVFYQSYRITQLCDTPSCQAKLRQLIHH